MRRELHTPSNGDTAARAQRPGNPMRTARPDAHDFLSRIPAFRNVESSYSFRALLLQHLLATLIAAVAIGLRFAVDPYLPPGFPYLTIFPAVIITGFFVGIAPAITCAVLSGLAAWYWFIPPQASFGMNPQSLTALIFYAVVIGIDLGLLQLVLTAYRLQLKARRELAENLAMQEVISDEIEHRIKNLLATILGLVGLSQRYASTPKELGDILRSRIQAMGSSISAMRDPRLAESADLRTTIGKVLEPLGVAEGPRLKMTGASLKLNPGAIAIINLIIHELATNAFKYGALGNESGVVSLDWSMNGDNEIRLAWSEAGGPPVTPPDKSGFGSFLITRMVESLGGRIAVAYDTRGLNAEIILRADRVLA